MRGTIRDGLGAGAPARKIGHGRWGQGCRAAGIGMVVWLAVLTGAAHAEDDRRWIGETYPDGATLVYGTPESDDAPISFVCELPAHALLVSLPLGDSFEPHSGTVTVKVAAEPGKDNVTLPGELMFLEEIGETIVEARGAFDVSLARILKQGKTLVVAVGDKTYRFPLEGAVGAMGRLEAACAAPR